MTVTHTKVTAIADDPAYDVGADEWNADHTINGTSLQVQYNNAGSLTGMAGTSWDNTNRSLTLTGATVTASKPVLDLTQTWNNVAVTFTGLKFNATDTTSAAGSLFLDFQKSGTSKFSIDKNGFVTINNSTNQGSRGFELYVDGGAAANADFGFASHGAEVDFYFGSITFGVYDPIGDRNRWDFDVVTDTGVWAIGSSGGFGFAPTTHAVSSATDTVMRRDAAGVLALRNSTTAQTYRVYNTYTNSTNYERAALDWTTTANTLTVGAQAAGTGTLRDVLLVGKNITTGTAALNTTATDGFLYIETCAGAPTGTPTSFTGLVPIVYDTTNNKLYVYNGAWKSVTLA